MTVDDSLPVDVETMRATAARLLADDAEPLSAGELETLTLTLRGHLELLIPEAERAAKEVPDDAPGMAVPVAGALVFGAEARRELDLPPHPALDVATRYARRLARSVNTLCDHLEQLGGERP
ncbi:DUF6415 family natural product biosynthesis protein [Streptomyces sp. NPDC002845]